MQSDFDLGEVGFAQQFGCLSLDPFRPQFTEEAKLMVGVMACQEAEEVIEVFALIERGVEQHNLRRTAVSSMLKIGDDLLFADEVEGIVTFGVVAELALEDTTANGFEQQQFLIGRVEDPFQVR